ncbi:hypothetical protein E4T85_19645 [Bacillus stratosphericus]|nr:hypothetical protein E4T99_07665 [Neisseria sp. WF04]TFV06949.1 hypothetical protein E4T85_19645 [Bacillus stratosphericus]
MQRPGVSGRLKKPEADSESAVFRLRRCSAPAQRERFCQPPTRQRNRFHTVCILCGLLPGIANKADLLWRWFAGRGFKLFRRPARCGGV